MKKNLYLSNDSNVKNFCVVRFITEYGECGFNLDIDFDMPSDDEVFDLFSENNTSDEVYSFFNIDYINDLFYEDPDVEASELHVEDVLYVRYAYGSVLYDSASDEYVERIANELGEDYYSEKVNDHLVKNLKGDVLVGTAVIYDVKNRAVKVDRIEEDDSSGMLM